MGKALGGGSGWVLLTRSARDGTLSNVWCADHTHSLAGGTPVLAPDMFEHSYHIDFGANPGGYVDAFMANIAWERVAARFAGKAFEMKPHTVDTTTARAMLTPSESRRDRRPPCPGRHDRTGPAGGARRAPPERVDEVAASLKPGTKALVYCAWGFEIGGDAAAKLRERGIDAVAVAGGIGAWRADGMPTEPHSEGEPNEMGDPRLRRSTAPPARG